MTVAALERRPRRAKATAPRIILQNNGGDAWTVSDAHHLARRFTRFETALDSARDTAATQHGTLEIWQDGQYVCCVTPETVPPPHTPASPAFTAAERYANRVARVVFAVAGPVFWLALMVLALAASLGWRLLLL